VSVQASTAVFGPVERRRSKVRLFEQAWIVGVVGYSVLRFVVAWGTLGEHGVNPWVFGVIDVGTAYPYAKSVAAVTKRVAARQWQAVLRPAAWSIAFFVAPYGYLALAAREAPAGIKSGLVLVIAVLAVAAVAGVASRSRKMRSEVIDLRDEVSEVREYAHAESVT